MRQRDRSAIAFWVGVLVTSGLAYVNFWVGFCFYCAMITVMTALMGRELGRLSNLH